MSCIQFYNSWPNNTRGQWLQTQVRRHNSANSRVHCCLMLPPVRKWRRVTHRMTRRRCIRGLQPALYWHFWRRQGVFKRLWWLFMLQSCQSLNSINSINTQCPAFSFVSELLRKLATKNCKFISTSFRRRSVGLSHHGGRLPPAPGPNWCSYCTGAFQTQTQYQ